MFPQGNGSSNLLARIFDAQTGQNSGRVASRGRSLRFTPKRIPTQFWRLELLFFAKLEFTKFALATELTNSPRLGRPFTRG